MNPKSAKAPDLVIDVDSVTEFTDVAITDPEELARFSAAINKRKKERAAQTPPQIDTSSDE